MQYKNLAKIYDNFSSDKPDGEWIDYIINIFTENKLNKNSNILDACCGTGAKTYQFYINGYHIIGLDNSKDMLEIAYERFSKKGAKIQLVNQDIKNISLHRKQDAVICINDGINYLTSLEDVKKAFTSIYNTLADGGLFVFDISTEYKLCNMDGNSYFEETEDCAYIWNNQYDKRDKILTMDISIFSQIEEDLFERSSEIHKQRAHSELEIITALTDIGFKNVSSYECFTFKPTDSKTNRIQFVANK